MKFVKRKAFSLLEISIVIMIIGILIAGIAQAIEMFSEASLKSARNLSKLSRVSRIEDLTLWLDATSSEAFDKEKDNNSTVSIWKDTNASAGSIISSSSSLASLYPSYASSAINKLPAVSFEKTSSLVGNCVTVPNGSFVNSSEDFTLYLIFSPKTLDDGIIIEKNNASATTFPFSLELLSGSYKFSVKNSTETISVIGSIKAKINTPNLIRLSRIKGSQIEISIDGISSTETDTLTSSTLNNAELAIGCRNGATPANFINGDIGETAFYNRNLNLKDKSDIEEYLYKKWKMKKFEGTLLTKTCNAPNANTTIDATSVNFTNIPISITCKEGYLGSPTYTCTGTGNLGTYYPGGTPCTAITCTAPASNGYLAQSSLAYTTTGSPGTITCDQGGYSGSVSYTCTASGPATVTGSCAATTCTAPASNGYLAQSLLAYKTAGSPGAITCDQAGYTGSVSYTCTTTGPATVTGTCTAVTCTAPASNGYLAQSLLAYTTSGLFGTIPCDQAGYTGSVSYTCTTSGPATVTGTCTAITCTAPASNGYLAQSLLAYKTAGSPGTITCDQAGYTGSVSYTCTATGPATVTGTCTAITCTAPASNGYLAKTGLAYKTAGSPGAITCDQAGYSGSVSYTCTATGPATVTGTCTAITCTVPTVNTTLDATSVNFTTTATSLTCKTGFTGSPTYTCTGTTNPGTYTAGGTACISDIITCNVSPTVNANEATVVFSSTPTATGLTCKAGFFGAPKYTCTGTSTPGTYASDGIPCAPIKCYANDMTGFSGTNYFDNVTYISDDSMYSQNISGNPNGVYINGVYVSNNQSTYLPSVNRFKLYDVYHGPLSFRSLTGGYGVYNIIDMSNFSKTSYPSYFRYSSNPRWHVRGLHNLTKYTRILDYGTNSFTCDSGYTGNLTYNCSDDGSTLNPASGTCVANSCTVSPGTGYSQQSNKSASGTFPCDVPGYIGTISYSCTTNGGTVAGTGNCTTITCTVPTTTNSTIDGTSVAYTTSTTSLTCKNGFAGSPNYTCTGISNPGTYLAGETPCTANTCSVSDGTGYTARQLSGSGTFLCDGDYVGIISYACTASSTATITGSCTLGCIYTETNTGDSQCLLTANATMTFTKNASAVILCPYGAGSGMFGNPKERNMKYRCNADGTVNTQTKLRCYYNGTMYAFGSPFCQMNQYNYCSCDYFTRRDNGYCMGYANYSQYGSCSSINNLNMWSF